MTSASSKVCLVTGAARGIGLATARLFLENGWRVALIDNNRETLGIAEKTIPADTGLCIECDVSDPDQVRRAVDQTAAHFGRLDDLGDTHFVGVTADRVAPPCVPGEPPEDRPW